MTAAPPPAAGALASMHPAYFAMVMATGIVSLAAWALGLSAIATVLFVLNLVFAAVMVLLTVLRAVWYPREMAADLVHHGRAVGFLTSVAATSVVGSQLLIIGGARTSATVLWYVAIALWAVLTYSILTILTVKGGKPSLAEGLNGGWLVAVVAPQSIVVLGTQLATRFETPPQGLLLFCVTMWLGAGMLYIWIISLIFYRYTFFTLSPSDLAPPYWINMGAVAISTLAGALLILAAPASALLSELLPFLKGFTLLFWATATWWIPMLVTLGAWRHLYARFPLRYDPLYWGAVFPLGMYTLCTWRLSEAIAVPSLAAIPRVTIYVALVAWGVTLGGLVLELARSAARNARRHAS